MTIQEKLSEIELHYNYWVGNFERKELTTNNVRIVAESICKALILKEKHDVAGTAIILGQVNSVPKNRNTPSNLALNFSDLIKVLKDFNILKAYKAIELQLELIRNKTNLSSHSSNKPSEDTTSDDLDVCNTSIKIILKWFYIDLMKQAIPTTILMGFEGTQVINDLSFSSEKWQEFQLRRFNSPMQLSSLS